MYISKINNANNNRKRKILLSTLIPCSVAVVGLSCGLGFGLGCKSNDTIFRNTNDIEKYLKSHMVMHYEPHAWTINNDPDMLSWLWDRNNFGKQNMINGLLCSWIASTSNYEFKIILNSGKNWFKLKITIQIDGQKLKEEIRDDINNDNLKESIHGDLYNYDGEYVYTSYNSCQLSSNGLYVQIKPAPTSTVPSRFYLSTEEYPNITSWPGH